MTVSTISLVQIKNMSYVAVYFATAEYLGFSTETTLALTILMIIDVATGITRSAMVEGTGSVRSSIWTRGILAKLLLITAIFSVALASKSVGIQAIVLANGALNVLLLSELYSILGNIYSIKNKQPKTEFDAVAWMLSQIKELLSRSLK